jgi:hypothetical protein
VKEVKVKALGNFSGNGVLRGSIGFFDPDTDDLLSEVDRPNWRREGVVEEAAAKVADEMVLDFPEYGMDLIRAITGLRKGLREARREQADGGTTPPESVAAAVPNDKPFIITNGV